MPTAVSLPACLTDCYRALYPRLDFSRVGFYSGLPTFISGPDGFTMASGAASPDIRVYIKDYEPCGKAPLARETFLVIAHELVHVIQIQGMLGGGHIPGSWTAYYTSQNLNCAGGWSTCSNALEKEAYDFANGRVGDNCGVDGKVRDFVEMTVSGMLPCDCASGPSPVVNNIGAQTYAEALKAVNLVKTESDVGRNWCSLLNWPVSLVAGAFSIFGFSNTGGAIGSGLGTVVGGIVGAWFGTVLGGVLGGIVGLLVGSVIGGLIGGVVGWVVNELGSLLGSLF